MDGLTDKKLHAIALDQFRLDCEQERDIRDKAEIDVDFRAGDQWNPKIKAARVAEGRPALSFNKTHIYIQSIANEARQNKPQPKVNPIGGGAKTDTANVINGILRHIQYRSQADVASDTALDHSTGSSFGFIRAITEFADPKSFDQEVRIVTVVDQFSIYGVLIPALRRQPCRHMFVKSVMSHEAYDAKYGTKERPTDFGTDEWGEAGENWINGDDVTVAEYWYVEDTKRTLRAITAPDGNPFPIYTDDPGYHDGLPFVLGEDGKPLERDVDSMKVCTRLMDGVRFIPGTETDWVGDSIPCVAVLGQQITRKGKHELFSLIRHIQDAQCLINIYKSGVAEKIGLMNRVPYVGHVGQFEDPKWLDCNVKNYPFLEVTPIVLPNGETAPLPIRQQLEEQIAALSQAAAQEVEDLKSGMGIYDASLGSRSNEVSGTGINARQQQANVTNFHFADNLNRALWDLLLKLLKVIPKIYNRPGRQVRIVGEDQQHSVVVVNQPYQDQETGKEKHYPLDVGEYDVVVTVGPSYTTARSEGADTLGQFFKAAPQTVPILGDLWVGSLDYTWAREGARRLKAAAPQNIVNEPDKGAMKIPPQIQQQLEKMNSDLQQAHAFAQSLHEQLVTKQPEIDARVAIAKMQEETKRTIALATIDSTEGLSVLENELNIVHKKVDAMHASNLLAQKQQHDAAMAANAQQHQAGMQQQAQGADSAAQASDQAHQQGMATQQQQAASDAQGADQQHQSDMQQNAPQGAD
jgi:hypothetical protein